MKRKTLNVPNEKAPRFINLTFLESSFWQGRVVQGRAEGVGGVTVVTVRASCDRSIDRIRRPKVFVPNIESC